MCTTLHVHVLHVHVAVYMIVHIHVHCGGVQVVVMRQLSESQGKRKTVYDHVQSRISSVSAMTNFTYMYTCIPVDTM